MSYLDVIPIPARKWKKDMESWEFIVRRDKERKRSQASVDRRIHYLWFHHLRLCMNLEEMGFKFQKKDGGQNVLEETEVVVNKEIYKDWSLNSLYEMKFNEWYFDQKHNLLFSEGGFKFGGRSRYASLVKRFNVFIEYHNRMVDLNFYKGDLRDWSHEMKVCNDIMELYQKERFDRLKINHPQSTRNNRSLPNKIVKDDVRDCSKTLLAVCQGRFPK